MNCYGNPMQNFSAMIESYDRHEIIQNYYKYSNTDIDCGLPHTSHARKPTPIRAFHKPPL